MKPRWIIIRLLVITWFGVALLNEIHAQEPNSLSQKPSGQFIRRWLALGPIVEGEPAPKAIKKDYLLLATGIPESKFATLEGAPKAGDSLSLTLEGYATQERVWKVLELPENGDVARMLIKEGQVDFAVAYLITFIELKESLKQERMLNVGYNDLVKVWLNGEAAYPTAIGRPPIPNRAKITLELRGGMNCLMFKVADSRAAWQLITWFAESADQRELQFFDTPDRQILPLGKPVIHLPNFQLENPKSELEIGAGTEGIWKVYQRVDGLANNYVTAIIQDQKGDMWFGTQGGGLSRFDGVSWKTYTQNDGLANNNVTAIIQDKDGTFWFGTQGKGASRFDGKIWKTYTQMDGLASDNVTAVMQDKAGAFWFGTGGWFLKGNGVSRFDGKSWQTFTQMDGLAGNNVRAIIQDQAGVMWFATNGGVSRFDGKNWQTFTQKDGLAHDTVYTIIQDKEGAMWFGTWAGVSRFDRESWKFFTQKDGLADRRVHAIMQDKEGAIWCGTNGGVNRFDGKSWQTFTQMEGLVSNNVFSIIQDKEGAFWFGGLFGGGISRFDGKSWKAYTQMDGLAELRIWEIMQDKKGAIWFGTRSGGLSRFDGKSWQTFTQKDGLAGNDVRAIIQDRDGSIWAGTVDGVSHFDGISWKTYTQKDGLASDDIYAIMQDKEGDIWFGTRGGGVSRFDGKNWQTYTPKEGLADNWVLDIIQDKEGMIWFGTWSGGVSRFDGRCFQTIDSRDGLPDNNVHSIYMDSNQQFWIGTQAGVVRFIPNKVLPSFYITRIRGDKTYENPKDRVQLKSGINRIFIHYHAISFKTRPGGMKYFYQLLGKDPDWQGPTNSETVEYSNLKPGGYTFKVQAVDRDLNYSEMVSLQLVLPPLWHQVGWIRAILVGGGLTFLCSFGFVTWRWSANRIAKRQLERKLREQETREAQLQILRYQLNPHFLFNVLNSIRALITKDHNTAKMMVTELSEYFRYSLQNPNSLEVSLKDEIESIRSYLAIEKVRFKDRLEVTYDIERSAEEFQMPVFLIQPLVENAIKYGMQTSSMPLKISLRAYVRNGSLQLEVLNTGKWFNAKALEDNSMVFNGLGIGLKNVQNRLNYAFPSHHRFDIFERDGWVCAVIEIDGK